MTRFWTPPTPLPFSIRLHPRGLLVGSYTDVGPQYSLLSPHGQLLAAFYQRDPRIGTTPYWNSVNRDYATVLGDAVIAGSSLLYPLRRFGPDGQLLGEFGIRPPSWRAAPEPDAGAFARGLADAPKLKRWLSSFTMITDIRSMSDSLILVAHGRFGAALEESNSMASLLRIHEESFDAYRPDGSRIAAEIRLPGDLVYTDETLYVLTAGPPAPWTISRYRLHGPPGR